MWHLYPYFESIETIGDGLEKVPSKATAMTLY